MKLTAEQNAIIQSNENICIQAVAGSGKTTTLIEYARTRPKGSKILYLAFNKSVKLEAIRKFEAAGLHNVVVETAHSLAYRYVVRQFNYAVQAQGYKSHALLSLLKIPPGDKHTGLILASHVLKFMSCFCNSRHQKISDTDYLSTLSDPKVRAFATQHLSAITAYTRALLNSMNKGEIAVTHDFYLKKFQLIHPELPYDYILFDEGQDASATMLEVFMKQNAVKVIVGDTHQQIYGWRYAVNSLEQVKYKTFTLSNSFRLNDNLAKLATEILTLKNHICSPLSIAIHGISKDKPVKTKAILARTNLGLLLRAITYINENKQVKHLYFEGNLHSYTYADEGTSLYDVLNLYHENKSLIRDPLLQTMPGPDELEEYIEKTGDVQLSMMVEIVKAYGSKIPYILKQLKDKHVPDSDRHKAEIIFSTIHRCKGMEYDIVELVNDFVNEEKTERFAKDENRTDEDIRKWTEEINMLYVAVTRSRNILCIPSSLLPFNFKATRNIIAIKTEEEINEEEMPAAPVSNKFIKQGQTAHKDSKYQARQSFQPWTEEQDDELTSLYLKGKSVKELSQHFGRTQNAINLRLIKLQLEGF